MYCPRGDLQIMNEVMDSMTTPGNLPDEPSRSDGKANSGSAEGEAAVRAALIEGRQSILRFLRRRLGHPDEAEEALQSFMLRAIERAGELRDTASVRGWLSRILATTIADHQRRRARKRQREQAMSPGDQDIQTIEPDAEVVAAICECLHQLLPTLRPEYAEVIRRIDLLEEPREQVAASLGLTANNLAVRLHRGRQALKARLEEMCLTCPVHGFLDCRCEVAERLRVQRESVRSG